MRQNQLVVTLLAGCLTGCTMPAPGEQQSAVLENPHDGTAQYETGAPLTGISYLGGPLLSTPQTLFLVFVGNVPAARKTLLTHFAEGLSGSSLANTLTLFTDASGNAPTGQFTVRTSNQPEPPGGVIDAAALDGMVNAVNGGANPSGSVYAFIGDSNVTCTVNDGTPFCGGACGWHHSLVSGAHYIFVGDPEYCDARGVTGCDWVSAWGLPPNNDGAADHMVNVLWHEFAEASSDPKSTGYRPEIGDLCEAVQRDNNPAVGFAQEDVDYIPSGSSGVANVHFRNGTDFHVQPIWQNAPGGGCVRRVALQKPSVSLDPVDATGDVDHTSIGDLLVRDSVTGTVSIDFFDAGYGGSGVVTLGGAAESYKIVGVFDFDGDGSTDILWRRITDGQLKLWTVNASTHAVTSHLLANSTEDGWVVKAVGDFDGDGFGDILFQSMDESQPGFALNVRVHYGNAALTSFSVDALPDFTPSIAYTVNADTIGAGDFDGIGRSQVLWRDLKSGAAHPYYYWTFNRSAHTYSSTNMTTASAFDQVLGLADIHADGKAHLLVINGSWISYVSPHDSVVHHILNAPAAQWRYVSSSPWLGYEATILWYNRETSAVHRWYLNPDGSFLQSVDVIDSMDFDLDPVGY